jgi:hypothetical protein
MLNIEYELIQHRIKNAIGITGILNQKEKHMDKYIKLGQEILKGASMLALGIWGASWMQKKFPV